MRVLFMGTDEFAIASLKAVVACHEVVAVVSQPDRPRGRGKKVSPTPVKIAAEKLGLPVLTPKSLKSAPFREAIAGLNYDAVVLVAYGRVLPEDFIEKPSKGCICLHPSKLPEYRGCSPIECAIRDGKKKTAISVFYIDKDVDTGDVIYQMEVDIEPEDTGGSLRERLSRESPDVLLQVLKDMEAGEVKPLPQCKGAVCCWAPKICKEDALIYWNTEAEKINNGVRAYNPKPGAYTYFRGKVLKINKAEVISCPDENSFEPGAFVKLEKNEDPVVSCGKGCLRLVEIQPEGKKPMKGSAFVLGYKPEMGEKLGEVVIESVNL